MSGVFGVASLLPDEGLPSMMREMGRRMSHRPWFETAQLVDPKHRFAIGRVGIGLFNRGLEPVWDRSETRALLMAGEIYSSDGAPAPADSSHQGRVILDLYLRHGDAFPAHLNGVFVVVIVDSTANKLIIANDRFGLYPTYYSQTARRLVFGAEMKAVLCDPHTSRQLDLTALAQYMRCQHLLGQRTFFESVRLLAPATVLTYDLINGRLDFKRYWDFDEIPDRPSVTFAEAVEETGRLLRRAVERRSSDEYRPGVYLSGGLDSRTILGLIKRRPVPALTYGTGDCRDVHYARRIARATGAEHYWCDFPDGSWIVDHADTHLALTEGLHSWIHAHGMSTLEQARRVMDVNLTGWGGGSVMSRMAVVDRLQTEAVDSIALTGHMFNLFNTTYTWPSIDEAIERTLYDAGIQREMTGRAFASFESEMSRHLRFRPDMRSTYFYIANHTLRQTFNMVTFGRSHVEYRFPFFDYELFDFLHSFPVALRGDHRLFYHAVIQRETPRLAWIPYDHDEFLPTTHSGVRWMHGLAVRMKRRVNRHIAPIFATRATLYADYENYLRHELREWAEEILFDRRTADRGIFRIDTVRSLFARHQSGLEPWTIGFIAPIMAYEMMLRLLVDDSSQQRIPVGATLSISA